MPGDKSISHRALIFPLLAQGDCHVTRLSPAADCQSTIACLRALGVTIEATGDSSYMIRSPGLNGLTPPKQVLDAGNSGTTIRLLSGVLAGQSFDSILDGDGSLRKRPMSRVLNHLVEMGANVNYSERPNYPPFQISGGSLQGKEFKLGVGSAQVQTALVLAGLQSKGETSIELPTVVRDHTERMLTHAGVPFLQTGLRISVSQLERPVPPFTINVAGDISSAAFFMVAAACLSQSHLVLTDVGLNPGRTLVLDALKEMGANIGVTDRRTEGGEPIGTITVRGGSPLTGITIAGDRIASGIDEIPILALAGALCEGTFSVRDAAELRVKESDRLASITDNLKAAGAQVAVHENGFDIQGVSTLNGGCCWNTHGDHRLAMIGLVANTLCDSEVKIDDLDCIAVSYPQFAHDLQKLLA